MLNVAVFLFIKRCVPYSGTENWKQTPFNPFTHACSLREHPLLSWTLAECCHWIDAQTLLVQTQWGKCDYAGLPCVPPSFHQGKSAEYLEGYQWPLSL